MKTRLPGFFKLTHYLKGEWKKIFIFLTFSLVFGFLYVLPAQFIGMAVDVMSSSETPENYKMLIYNNITKSPIILILIAGIMMIFLTLFDVVFGYLVSIFGEKIKVKVRKQVIKKIICNYNSTEGILKEGEILSRVYGDINSINSMIVAPINGLFRSLIEIFWIATIFFIWNTKLAIIAIILTIPIYFLAKKIGEVSKRKFGEISVINDDLNQYTLSILKNSKVIHTSKTYQKEIISASNFINDSYIKTNN